MAKKKLKTKLVATTHKERQLVILPEGITEELYIKHLSETLGIPIETVNNQTMNVMIYVPLTGYNHKFSLDVKYKPLGFACIKNIQDIVQEARDQNIRCTDGDIMVNIETGDAYMLEPTRFRYLEKEQLVAMITTTKTE